MSQSNSLFFKVLFYGMATFVTMCAACLISFMFIFLTLYCIRQSTLNAKRYTELDLYKAELDNDLYERTY